MKMRIQILYIILFLVEVLFAQNLEGSTFKELRGFEDNLGNTHLFYHKYSLLGNCFSSFFTEYNEVFHLDLATIEDILFLQDYFYEGFGISIRGFIMYNTTAIVGKDDLTNQYEGLLWN